MRNVDREDLIRWLHHGEDAVYIITGILLGVAGVALLVGTAGTFWEALRSGQVRQNAVQMLDSLLVILILVELMRTIRVSLVERVLAPEPFIVVALIAGVRRILLLTAETGWFFQTYPDQLPWILAEVGLFTVFLLVAVGALAILRRTEGAERSSEENLADDSPETLPG